MGWFSKKLVGDQAQACREAQRKSAFSGKYEIAQVGNALASSEDGKTAGVHNRGEKGHRNSHIDVKPKRFWG